MNKKIVFLKGFYPNPRCERRIEILKNYYDISLLYWEKNENSPVYINDSIIVKRELIKANLDNPLKRILPYFEFRNKALDFLKKTSPVLISPEAVDMLDIAVSYKKHFNNKVKIVYEVADLHRFIIDEPQNIMHRILRSLLRRMEEKDLKYTNKLILTSDKFYDIYYKDLIKKEDYLYIPNTPDLGILKNYSKISNKRSRNRLTIGFIGKIRYLSQMEMLIEVATRMDWNILFAGSEDKDYIKNLVKNMPNVEYFGRYNYEKDIVSLYQKCDVIYSVYNADMKNVKVALPNKLYESIWCELPIIVAKGTYLSSIVEELGVGISVSHIRKDDLVAALKWLSVTDNYKNIQENCKKAKFYFNEKEHKENLVNLIDNLV